MKENCSFSFIPMVSAVLIAPADACIGFECLAGAPRLAASGAGLWLSLGGLAGLSPRLEVAGGLLGLLEILRAGAPEDHTRHRRWTVVTAQSCR